MNADALDPTVARSPSLKEIFLTARELIDPQQRKRYLDDAVGNNQELRQRVEQMLTAQQGSGASPLAEVAEQLRIAELELDTTAKIDISDHPMLGPYKLLEEIGRGGMGAVYMAQQTEPIKRKVALKVIKPGMDTREVIARFEAERQALAMMDHPHIAKVLDGGTTPQGRPYFVMELVRGVPLNEFCKSKKLSLPERLKLFVNICQAVQHAHQKGIIHRDLKPSNLLVTLHDGVPVVKVIDFGVAKALNQELTERTLFTQFSQMIGTPLYMAPEQAEMSGLDVDTRSDIYSLGVVLYELLTGTTPFDRSALSQLGFDGVRKLIKEHVPPRPSVRVSTLKAADQSTIEDQRSLVTEENAKKFKRELDWIVMKALEKDRERRYESATALATDVKRYLNDEPVQACPPTFSYLLRKFSKRNKGLLTSSMLIALSLIVGTSVSLWMYAGERTARRDAESQKTLAEENAQLAEQSFQQARETVDQYLTRVSENILLKQPGMQSLRKDLLQLASSYYQDFAAQHVNDPLLQEELADAYTRTGDIVFDVASIEDALLSYLRAIEIRQQLSLADPNNLENKFLLAVTYVRVGHTYALMTRLDEARNANRDGLQLLKTLVDTDPAEVKYKVSLAHAYGEQRAWLTQMGDIEGEIEVLENTIEILNEIPSDRVTPRSQVILASGYRELANAIRNRGESTRAIDLIEQAVAITEQLLNEEPNNQEFLFQLSRHQISLSIAHGSVANNEASLKAIQQATGNLTILVEKNPAVSSYKWSLAAAYDTSTSILHALGNESQAIEMTLKSRDIREALVAAHPADTNYKRGLAITYANLGVMKEKAGNYAEAKRDFLRCHELRLQLVKDHSQSVDFRYQLSKSHSYLANVETLLGNPEISMREYEQATDILHNLAIEHPGILNYKIDYGGICCNAGSSLIRRDRFQDALPWFSKAISQLNSAKELDAQNVTVLFYLANTFTGQGRALLEMKDFGAALQAFSAEYEIRKQLALKQPSPDNEGRVALSLRMIAGSHDGAGETELASKFNMEAILIQQRIARENPTTARHITQLGGMYCDFGHNARDHGDMDKALEWYRQAIQTLEPLLESDDSFTVKIFLRNTYFGLAQTKVLLERYEDAIADWDEALRFSQDKNDAKYGLGRARTLALAGKRAQAIAEAKRWLETSVDDPALGFTGACILALASGSVLQEENLEAAEKQQLSDEYAAKALQLLEQASEAGFFADRENANGLRDQKDLDPLRDRETFQRILGRFF